LGSEELIIKQIKNLLERRMRSYCISDFILDTSFKEIFELVDEIIEHIYNIVT
jgi:hypothetical protein